MSYTPEQIKQAIDSAIGKFTDFEYQVVTELPEVGEPYVLYLLFLERIPLSINNKMREFAIYMELVYKDGKWKYIGIVDEYKQYLVEEVERLSKRAAADDFEPIFKFFSDD